MILHVAASLFLRAHLDLMPGFAVDIFGRDEQGLALLLSASGIGAMIVAVLLTLYAGRIALLPVLIWSEIVAGAFLVLFTATDQFLFGTAALVVGGGMAAATGIASSTMIQQSVDNAYRGRVISITLAMAMGAPAFGALAIGWFAEFIGLQWSVGGGAVIAILVAAAMARPLFARRRFQSTA